MAIPIFSYFGLKEFEGYKRTNSDQLSMNVVKNMIEKAVLQQHFKYLPHVSSEGRLMAFELTERNSSYAMALVVKHFVSNNALPAYPHVKRGEQALLKIENISKSCNAVAILSTVGYHSAVRAGNVKNLISLMNNRKCSTHWPDLPWLHTDSWMKSSKNKVPVVISDQSESQPEDLCFLQFTSGSTGDAKRVMIMHGGLVYNVNLMKKGYKSTLKTVLVS